MSAYTPDEMLVVLGFTVEIEGAGGGSDVDSAWESVSGGELIVESAAPTVGGDKFATNSPGHKSVGEITLRGAMTDKRAGVSKWITETVQGKAWKRTVSITPFDEKGTPGHTYVFFDCVLSAYRLPRLSARGGKEEKDLCEPEPLQEELRFTYRDWTVRG